MLMAGFFLGCAGAPVRTGPSADRDHIRFSIRAPNADQVVLVLIKARTADADTQKIPAEKQPRGIWSISLPLPPGSYRYFFMVDGSVTVEKKRGRVERDDFGGVTGVLTVKGLLNGDMQVY